MRRVVLDTQIQDIATVCTTTTGIQAAHVLRIKQASHTLPTPKVLAPVACDDVRSAFVPNTGVRRISSVRSWPAEGQATTSYREYYSSVEDDYVEKVAFPNGVLVT